MTIKALTIYQPFASLLAVGAKKFETRSWKTSYRGRIAIHAGAKSFEAVMRMYFPIGSDLDDGKKFAKEMQRFVNPSNLPLGAIVAVADLVSCWRMYRTGSVVFCMRNGEPFYPSEREKLFGGWADGRFAWELQNVKLLDNPVKIVGHQGLWNWEENRHD